MSTQSEIFIEGKKHIPASEAFTGWSVSKGFFYEEFNAEKIKGVKIGRAYYVDIEAFEEYCTERGYTRKPIKQAEEASKEANLEGRVIRLEALMNDFIKFLEINKEPAQVSLLKEEAA